MLSEQSSWRDTCGLAWIRRCGALADTLDMYCHLVKKMFQSQRSDLDKFTLNLAKVDLDAPRRPFYRYKLKKFTTPCRPTVYEYCALLGCATNI